MLNEATLKAAITAPPKAPPMQAPINGFPRGRVTPYINGSPTPSIPTGRPESTVFFSLLFLVFANTASAAPMLHTRILDFCTFLHIFHPG